MPRAIAASDVGGTFTDLVLWDGHRLHTLKKVTDPGDRQRVVLEGTLELLRRAGLRPRDLARVIHGTTAATNAVLQRRGGRVGLVTNQGFEDLIEIARQNRPRLYDLAALRPLPLVPRGLRLGVPGRLDHRGRELQPLDEASVRRAARRLRRAGVEAAAVCFLHSYRSPRHERAAARILERSGIRRVSTSSDVAPEVREYERFTTTIVNAFLQPVFEDSLRRLEEGFRKTDSRAPLFVIESSGGMLDATEAQRSPVRTVLSGPAGGVAAAGELARRLRLANALTFDMGGTSTDLAILRAGRPSLRTEADVAGFPLRTPALDLTTIGAGGGSLARIDTGGILTVGPESAEAWPGPACYGRGGKEPTVTDADVLLGRIDATGFLVGSQEVRLQPARARDALRRLGRGLGLNPEDAAVAVLEVANANLQRGIRLVTTQRGLDPADYTLIAFGGAGPMHGIDTARALGLTRVVVPAQPAVFSAWGMLVSDIRHTVTAAVPARSDATEFLRASRRFQTLDAAARRRLVREGFPVARMRLSRAADLRYLGQSHELTIPVERPTDAGLARAAARFHREHQRLFGHSDARATLELVALRVQASATPRPAARVRPLARARSTRGSPQRRRAFLLHDGFHDLEVVGRSTLGPGERFRGPIIVEGGDHTFLLPARSRALVRPAGDLEVRL